MTAIIARLEAATEGSRELDALIWLEADHDRAQRVYNTAALGMPRAIGKSVPDGLGRLALEKMAPLYTTSIDAALPWEDIHRVERVRAVSKEWWNAYQEGSPEVGKGATESLARRIAALKARSAP